jgi:hypothetical protein
MNAHRDGVKGKPLEIVALAWPVLRSWQATLFFRLPPQEPLYSCIEFVEYHTESQRMLSSPVIGIIIKDLKI